MAIEQKWAAVPPQLFTVDGSQYGVIKVTSAYGFKVKQRVIVSAASLPTLSLQIKRVVGPDTIIVGDFPTKQGESLLTHRKNLTAYTVALGSYIYAEEQDKSRLKPEDSWAAVYSQEPTNAVRTLGVDPYGDPWSEANPLPVEGTIIVSNGEPTKIEMQNIPVAVANTEFTIDLPDNTKRYQISVRDHKAKGRIAFVPTETATNYRTHTRGTITDSYGMNLPINSKVYMQIDQVPAVIEVMIWTKP